MFAFKYFKKALAVSKYSKPVLAVLLVGLVGSALVAANTNSSLQSAGAAVGSLAVTCTGSPSTISPGGTVTWRATVTGGTGSYAYHWIGNGSFPDGATTNPVNVVYTGVGGKQAN